MSSRNFIPFVQLKLRWNFGGQIKSTTHRWLWPRVWASEFDNPCQCLHLDFVMIFYGIKFSSVSKFVIQWFYTLYHDSCVKITFWIFYFFFLIFHVIFMPKHTALKLHTTTSAVGLKWLYLKSELTMLHTCFLMTIYSTCTWCILTEFSFIYGVV